MFRLSPLKLRVFRGCRLRYKYQYVDKLPARLRPQDTAGTCVHNVLCEFFAKVAPQERSKEKLLSMFQERWQNLSPRFLRMASVEDLRQRAMGQLERFARQQDLSAQPLMVEAFFQAPVAPDLTLFGRIDRIDEEADRSLHLIDYKTGAHPEEVDANQLRLYAIIVQKCLERPVSRASFWYLDDGLVWSAPLRPQDLEQTLAEALVTVEEMARESHFPPTIAPHCGHCPYLYACQYREEIAQRRRAEDW